LAYNVVKTIGGVALEGGRHTLKGVINGKNEASSGFAMTLTKYWLLRTGD
jgi:hypothetical protein